MKKIFSTFFIFVFIANVSAQLEVNSSGDTQVSKSILLGSSTGFLGTTSSSTPFPLTFKVNNVLAGFTGSSGNSNVSFGYQSLNNSLKGSANVAVGFQALYTNTIDGHCNTATGWQALFSNTDGNFNTATGFFALAANTEGWHNTAIGDYALSSNSIGCNNTAIGHQANVFSNALSNATAIGSGATVTASHQVRIGNGSVSSIGGNVAWTNLSDGRTKRNILTNVPGLAFINRLQPITYNLNLDALDELQKSDDPKINHFRDSLRMARSSKQKEIDAQAKANKEKIVYSGFIAQDVETAAQSVGYDFSGVDAPENGKGAYGLRYAEFVVPLVKAVQELSEQNVVKDVVIASLQEQANEFIETLKVQQGIINELKQKVEKLEENTPAVNLRSGTEENSVMDLPDAVVAQCKLYQNTPNPFNQNTQIRFYIPESVNVAQLCIYNLQGTQIKQILIAQRGESSQWISGSELSAGMYLYALIVDGKEVDTKRMILTK